MKPAGLRVAVALAVVFALVGCSAGAGVDDRSNDPSSTPTVFETVEVFGQVFTGPYAAEFGRIYAGTNDELAHWIVEDSEITAGEIAELSAAYISCAADVGLRIEIPESLWTWLMEIPPTMTSDEAWDLLDACETRLRWVSVTNLYGRMKINPFNEDIFMIVAACIVRLGLRPEGYSTEDYRADFNSPTPDDSLFDDPRFNRCMSDPKNA
jgi:hypothetical protein